MSGFPLYDSLVEGINKALNACGMKEERKWIGAGVYLIIVVALTVGMIAFAGTQLRDFFNPSSEVVPSSHGLNGSYSQSNNIIDSPNVTFTQNSNNNTYNEFPQPELSYRVATSSTLQEDGLYKTSFLISMEYVSGTVKVERFTNKEGVQKVEAAPLLEMIQTYEALLQVCQIDDENSKEEADFYGITTLNVYLICVTEKPIPDNGNLFWLKNEI